MARGIIDVPSPSRIFSRDGVARRESGLGLELVLISPREPSGAQAPRNWADFVHIRYIAAAAVEGFTFKSFDGREVEAFLTKPGGQSGASKHPLIVMIHGGPHGQQGPAFNSKAQIYAAEGWATLMVNYRGSTGYGQKHADAIFKDQDGGEAKDVLAGVDAALAKYPWLDAAMICPLEDFSRQRCSFLASS